ncbi:MAG TPA: 3-phosphoshikimate 1-carboxyvinyltransferase [Phycisphaerales bacterium]|nr:MAG: 3-phosphoshikimate 1-carboxyvinyltransferase [Planctomycetes bacterium GWC2_45_44]HBG77685.1 3-phosphoshikimate 1-carboxyvinyltransferase [Phycisphaerales bacterium]HBR20453.1 3-phosphoshikimate 1-carboxyvinyltransferase [Phycisphaerales bacterium]
MKNIGKIKNLNIEFTAPPSKAHTLRALAIAGLAEGQTIINNPLLADDQQNMIGCLRRLGIGVEIKNGQIFVNGGSGKFSPLGSELNVGESGVTMNFLTAAACLCDKPVILTGSARIQERPVDELVSGLRQLGCKIDYLKNEGCVPVKIHGGGINGGTAKMHGQRTSQYFSALVISAALAKSDCVIECVDEMTERPYFDISVDMMAKFGGKAENKNYKKIIVPGRQKYLGREITIEGDHSSASFFFLAAAICKAQINIKGLQKDSKQGDKAFVDLLAKMGCKVEYSENSILLAGGELKSIEQDMSNIPDLVPPIAVAAGFAKGKSKFTNIGHLRHKECDRLAVVAEELNKMGIKAFCDDDSLTVIGNSAGAKGAVIDPHNDHRIAMSFAAAGLVVGNQRIDNEKCVGKSFPDFWEKFEIFYK